MGRFKGCKSPNLTSHVHDLNWLQFRVKKKKKKKKGRKELTERKNIVATKFRPFLADEVIKSHPRRASSRAISFSARWLYVRERERDFTLSLFRGYKLTIRIVETARLCHRFIAARAEDHLGLSRPVGFIHSHHRTTKAQITLSLYWSLSTAQRPKLDWCASPLVSSSFHRLCIVVPSLYLSAFLCNEKY